ncbi:MAG: Pathogenicity locus [Roseivirga sp.]|nr:Pathogenicity locus [Roseivirga sp.]
MKTRSNIKLPLSDQEKASLRKNKVKIAQVLDYAADELEVLLGVTTERAKELYALALFQTIPSIGIKFAEDLVFLGYYSINELKGKDGAKLTDDYELKKGYWIDSCVEDQFRLIVHYANTGDTSKTWWDFTKERKAFRSENGYPANRPKTCWTDVLLTAKKAS